MTNNKTTKLTSDKGNSWTSSGMEGALLFHDVIIDGVEYRINVDRFTKDTNDETQAYLMPLGGIPKKQLLARGVKSLYLLYDANDRKNPAKGFGKIKSITVVSDAGKEVLMQHSNSYPLAYNYLREHGIIDYISLE